MSIPLLESLARWALPVGLGFSALQYSMFNGIIFNISRGWT